LESINPRIKRKFDRINELIDTHNNCTKKSRLIDILIEILQDFKGLSIAKNVAEGCKV